MRNHSLPEKDVSESFHLFCPSPWHRLCCQHQSQNQPMEKLSTTDYLTSFACLFLFSISKFLRSYKNVYFITEVSSTIKSEVAMHFGYWTMLLLPLQSFWPLGKGHRCSTDYDLLKLLPEQQSLSQTWEYHGKVCEGRMFKGKNTRRSRASS